MYQKLSAAFVKNHEHLDQEGVQQLIKIQQEDMQDTAGYGDHDLSAFHHGYIDALHRLLEYRETVAELNGAVRESTKVLIV